MSNLNAVMFEAELRSSIVDLGTERFLKSFQNVAIDSMNSFQNAGMMREFAAWNKFQTSIKDLRESLMIAADESENGRPVSIHERIGSVRVVKETKSEDGGLIEKRSNQFVSVEFNEKRKSISGSDLVDRNNEPCFYSKSKRGLKTAWTRVRVEFNETTRMHDILVILEKENIRVHSYCAVD